MYEDTNLRCRNCRFWWPLADDTPLTHLREHAARGQCRRHPPPPAADMLWAVVQRDDWCGEHAHISI